MNETVEVKAEVRYLSLVRKEGGEPIIGIPYRAMSVDPDLVASFVLAVIIFENRQLKTFVKEGYVVVIEEGAFPLLPCRAAATCPTCAQNLLLCAIRFRCGLQFA